MLLRPPILAALLLGAIAVSNNDAHAEGGVCRAVDVDFVPSDKLQIAIWLEDAAGNYVDTLFLTQSVARYGMGNRPGELNFNSAPLWPYGRRETTFPVWAHRHGFTFPRIEFQNGEDQDLSHSIHQSSRENHYCRPTEPSEAIWDTGTCASPNVDTDKGAFSTTHSSLYPPRVDVVPEPPIDSTDVVMYAALNPFDAVSQATPPGGEPYSIAWTLPSDLPSGQYVIFAEVSKEFDDNTSYNATNYPAPTDITFANYGLPYRGQPSVVYSVPFTVGDADVAASSASYVGYGDPDGQDGMLRAPDDTIQTGTPGSGAERLTLTMGADNSMYRLRVTGHTSAAGTPPTAITNAVVTSVDQESAHITFDASGVQAGTSTEKVTGYEIRYQSNTPITDDNFASALPLQPPPSPEAPGTAQEIDLTGLLPLTTYYVGIRAYDDCKDFGPLVTLSVTTSAVLSGEVDACFIATAAYGSLMANDVVMLRSFRDAYLRSNVLGELVTEAYYTFGPAAAEVIGQSEVLRATTRDALAPVVKWARGLSNR